MDLQGLSREKGMQKAKRGRNKRPNSNCEGLPLNSKFKKL
jgi:hypothetical protein